MPARLRPANVRSCATPLPVRNSPSREEQVPVEKIVAGLTGHAEMMVGTSDTAPRIGSGRIAVLATPKMISLVEEAALAAVEHLLPEGKQSLGTHIDISHIAATPVGMTVKAEAELVAVDGRKLAFTVRAYDEMDLIGEGRHDRVVVTAASFQARIDEKGKALKA
jgi:fluoroacetyl-CoA thioesterase